MSKKIRLAVVGIGRISTAHVRGIQNSPNVTELVALVSRNETRLEGAAEKFNVRQTYTNYEDALKDPNIDGVVLCTPNELHHGQAVAAARSGKHVLVEKPMALNTKEAIDMERVARENGITLMVAQCRRFFEAPKTARARLAEIGDVIDTIHFLGVQFSDAQTSWWNNSKMKHLIVELNAPHPLDTTLYLLDEAPATIYAVGGRFNPKLGGTSQATIVLTFESGKTATAHLSFHCAPSRNERIIIGTKGTMRIKDEKDLWIGSELAVTEEYDGDYLNGGINFDRQIREFCSAIIEKREPLASGREIVRLMRVLDAVKVSLDEKRVVSLEDPAPTEVLIGER